MTTPIDRARIRGDFARAVNMSADEIEDWLETPQSRRVGQVKPGASESVGH